jgi:signal transduction histidine kinase
MRLVEFIVRDMQAILANWQAFAGTRLPAAETMYEFELRDHAQQILEAVVADLRNAQTPAAQAAKSMGLAPVPFNAPETAAQTHAVLRAKSGFDIEQLASEYRALRASVLSLWSEECLPAEPSMVDVIRFNEAIDQALAESIAFFSAHVDRARNLLVGMLSHDLRTPLQTIQMTALHLQNLNTSDAVSQAATRLIRSGTRMNALLDDLMDYNRTTLGLGIRVTPAAVDLGSVCADELEQVRAAYPNHVITLDVTGDGAGSWDAGRIQQMLSNLVVNAVHYGTPGEAVHVALQGSDQSEIHMQVANSGPSISPAILRRIFEPLQRGPSAGAATNGGLGLGLYIAAEIARAHGGELTATSESGRTVFVARLPRGGQGPDQRAAHESAGAST